MDINYIHNFDLKTEAEFDYIQQNLKSKICLTNSFELDQIKLCAGIDIAYFTKQNIDYGVCSIIVVDYNTKAIIEKVSSYGKVETPYISGYLAFRELPLILDTFKKLNSNPDIFMFDGNGYLHFNHMGIATHASFFLNKPTIGVAKSYLKIKNVDYIEPLNDTLSYTDIIIDDEVYGRVLRSRENVKPIFISVGNYIDLDTTTKIVISFLNNESRIPIPTRLADLETHKLRENLLQN